jgi:hypothetical protein
MHQRHSLSLGRVYRWLAPLSARFGLRRRQPNVQVTRLDYAGSRRENRMATAEERRSGRLTAEAV